MSSYLFHDTRFTRRILSITLVSALASSNLVKGQDTTRRQTIEITSSFKPVMRPVSKIGFATSPPPADTTRPRLRYEIPVQNLVPGLAPFALRPVTREVDSAGAWQNSSYVKAGFGNLTTPFAEAGLSLGDTRQRFNLFASHISSRGKLDFQDYGQTRIRGDVAAPVGTDKEWFGQVGLSQDRFYQFGFDKALLPLTEKSDILRRYNSISAETGLRNLSPTEFGLRFQPRFKTHFLLDNRNATELALSLNLPMEKRFSEQFALSLGVQGDLVRLSPDNADGIVNHLVNVPVAVDYRTTKVRVKAGITPSWDKGEFHLLPVVRAEFPVAKEKLMLQAGWISYYDLGSYKRLAGMNPWMDVPSGLMNTRMTERFAGFKGMIAKGFSYSARAGVTTFRNTPLFVNKFPSGRAFGVIFEEQLDALHIRGELGYIQGEQFTFQSGLNLYGFGKQTTEDRAWGMQPLQIDAHLRWRLAKGLWITSDAWLWQGALFKTSTGSASRLGGALDLNAGLEFSINKRIGVWTRFQNITNKSYQRWNQYQAYGFNMLGGVTFRFAN
jgi:hypothetical protein